MQVMTIHTQRRGYEGRSYLLMDEGTGMCAAIDPDTDGGVIEDTLRDRGLTLAIILLTHGHYDHIGCVQALHEAHGCPVAIHQLDAPKLTDPEANLSAMIGAPMVQCPPTRLLEDGDEIQVGDLTVQVLHVPGHTEGGVAYLCQDVLFSGDTLFWNSVGRWDFPGGNKRQLFSAIGSRLLTLPEDIQVYPGHFGPTTIGHEKHYNPYAQELQA